MAIDTDVLRQKLLDLRASLLEASSDASIDSVELDQTRVGRLSRMDAMQVQAMAKASFARREANLKKISAALARLERGDYGDCESCGEAINPKRLDFDPAANLCIDCAEKQGEPR